MSWSNGPSDQGGAYGQRPPRKRFFESMRASGWYRAHPRVIGGVCSGIAARSGWDLSLVRVLTVIAALCLPFVTLAYGLAWLLLPEAQDGRIHAEETAEGRFDIAFLGGLLLCLVSVSSVLPSVGVLGGVGIGLGASWLGFLVVSAFVVGLIAFVISNANKSGKHQGTGSAPQYGTPSTPGGAGTTAPFGQTTPTANVEGDTMGGQQGPQYGTPQYTATQEGQSAPFGAATPAGDVAGNPMNGQQGPQAPSGYPVYGMPATDAPGATSAQAGPRPAPARPSQPHPGWTPPPSAPRPRRWAPLPVPTHRPRVVSTRANMAITGLLILVVAAVFAGIYMVDKGPAIPFITAETGSQTVARIIVIGGGVCLIIVGLSLAIAALRDRSAGWLTTLSVLGMIAALPTAAIGTEATQQTISTVRSTVATSPGNNTVDWTVSSVEGVSPLRPVTLDLTGAPVGTTKQITVSWQAWQNLTIQTVEGQPVQIVCQSDITSVATNMDRDGWATPLRKCAGQTATSPSWGNSSLGGITVFIDSDADIEHLTILQSPDSSGVWSKSDPSPSATPSATPSPTPSATPSATPSPTPSPTSSGTPSGN